ncbi:MAG: helix-turn-helix transcriptional regulator [Candidatus Sungbacteria bacterium]|nr:helix-turn-helix transcriptional regulator [Candidatus Sungbacteria bacterium]
MSFGRDDERRRDREKAQREIGAYVRAARKKMKRSQMWLAREAGVSPVYVSQIETGVRLPSLGIAKAIAIVLGLDDRALRRQVFKAQSPEAAELLVSLELVDADAAIMELLPPNCRIPAMVQFVKKLVDLPLLERDKFIEMCTAQVQLELLRKELGLPALTLPRDVPATDW